METPTTPTRSTQNSHTPSTPTTPHSESKQRRLLSSQRIPSQQCLQRDLTTSPQTNFDTRTPTNPSSQRSNFLKHSRSHSSGITGSFNNIVPLNNNINSLVLSKTSTSAIPQVKPKQPTPYFLDYALDNNIDLVEKPVLNWRIENRIRTAGLGIVLALNLRVGSPDAPPTPRPHEECWIIPSRKPQDNAIEIVNNRLQDQYSQWAPRSNSKNRGGIKYKSCLDPTIDDVNKLCTSLRQYSREKRVLFHYNGHGVPRPTQYGELWVLNKDLTQYIPLSLFDLQNWIKTPTVFVFDCSNAGLLISWLLKFCEQREDEIKRAGTTSDHSDDSEGSFSSYKDFMAFGACAEDESLPSNPELPADLFTACITTPIKMALSWSCSRSILLKSLSGKERQYKELIEHIPGTIEDRTSPFGELNWIFTSITDTIAWQSLPSEMFQNLFRQDAVVASLFRNFLLADRIMRHAHCTPVSYPRLPPTHQHPLWQTWDQVVDVFLSQLPSLVNGSEQYRPSRFFEEQLMAFEVWLNFGMYQKRPPEQLPILLQALLSPIHRFKALKLLRSYLDLGVRSVNLALSVGVFHYILRLLQKSSSSNIEVLVQIWCKILSVDRSCQGESIKASNQFLFIKVLANKEGEYPIHLRSAAGFVLAVLMDQYPAGQLACYQSGILKVCDELLLDPDPILRYTALICLGKMWEDNKEIKFQSIKEQVQDRVCSRITDSTPKVRAAALFALGTFIYTGNPNGTLELSLANSLRLLTSDISPIVRRELIGTLSMTIAAYEQRFIEIAISTAKQEAVKQLPDSEREACRVILSSPYGSLWRALCSLQVDPIPEIAQSANRIIISIHCVAANIILENPEKELYSELIHSQLLQVATSNQQKNSTLSTAENKNSNSSYSKGDRIKKHFHDWRTRSSYKQPSTNTPNSINSVPNLNRSSQVVTNSRASTMIRSRNSVNRLYVPDKSQLFNEYVYTVQTTSFEAPQKDLTSPAEQAKQWKRQQQSLMLNAINEVKAQVATSKLETQVSVMDNQPYPITKMLVHPSYPIIVAASNDTINIWDWKEANKITAFSNTNSQNTYISSLSFVNQLEDSELLMTGASDGIIRVWSANFVNEKSKYSLVTAWRAHKQPNNSSGLVHIWNERAGVVITAGEYPIMRVWDIERGLATQDIPTESQSCITSMTYDKSSGNIVIVGAVDGSVRVFDCRMSSKTGLIQTYSEHSRPIVNVEMLYRSNKIVSGSFGGDVRFWDLRMSTSTSVLQAHSRSDMTTLAVHLQAPIVATGTHKQTIKVSNHEGTRLSDIKYYNKFLGQRIGAVSSLCFHPYEPLLAAGGTDCVIAMYQSSVCSP